MIDRVAHAGLRGEMDHAREPLPGEHIEQVLAIGNIDLFEPERLVVLQNGEPRLLQGGIVVRVHAVEADNDAPLLQQLLGDMKADEAGRSRDEHRVLRILVSNARHADA